MDFLFITELGRSHEFLHANFHGSRSLACTYVRKNGMNPLLGHMLAGRHRDAATCPFPPSEGTDVGPPFGGQKQLTFIVGLFFMALCRTSK